MSKFKLSILQGAPLYLKFHGRIVGVVSRMNLALYSACGLVIVVSMMILILFASTSNQSNHDVDSEQKNQSQVAESVQVQVKTPIPVPSSQQPTSAVIAPVSRQPVESVDEIEFVKTIKGAIQLDFGWQFNPVYQDWRYHTGIDISGPMGQSVAAIASGQVVDIFRDRHSGLTVVVKNNIYQIYYGSLSEVTVSKESYIKAGQILGIMGSCQGEPYNHVHLAIKKGADYIDPKLILGNE